MSTYSTYDFEESLKQVTLPSKPKHVVRAWGYSPEGYGSWTGGFLMELEDGQYAYLSGWCDTTGWGCQDGASVVIGSTEAEALKDSEKPETQGKYDDEPGKEISWDESPLDLNNWISGGMKDSYA